MTRYIGLLSQGEFGMLYVVFPDLPGCVSSGGTLEVHQSAKDYLAFYIEGMIEDGLEIPKPFALAQALADPDNESDFAVAIDASVSQHVEVVVPTALAEYIDKVAKDQGLT